MVCWYQVVYRTIPTSNHNCLSWCYFAILLYIVLFLHQTTTLWVCFYLAMCCISYYSYIKPQPDRCLGGPLPRCISYYSYIKPQRCAEPSVYVRVVYRTIPTSNHNSKLKQETRYWVVYRTIPTSNHNYLKYGYFIIFVVYRTIPTSNHNKKWQLSLIAWVVYRTIPTSNHNLSFALVFFSSVVYRTIPTSNHNTLLLRWSMPMLYIVLFLHQTTTSPQNLNSKLSCISYYSYIKPQPIMLI